MATIYLINAIIELVAHNIMTIIIKNIISNDNNYITNYKFGSIYRCLK